MLARGTSSSAAATHWEGWVDEKIPALGGKSPRQAVKSADGRESVEALLRSAERRAASDRDMGEEIHQGGRGRAAVAQPAPEMKGKISVLRRTRRG